jgi:hypothetical protein
MRRYNGINIMEGQGKAMMRENCTDILRVGF